MEMAAKKQESKSLFLKTNRCNKSHYQDFNFLEANPERV